MKERDAGRAEPISPPSTVVFRHCIIENAEEVEILYLAVEQIEKSR
jgi:predicted DNA-binding protein